MTGSEPTQPRPSSRLLLSPRGTKRSVAGGKRPSLRLVNPPRGVVGSRAATWAATSPRLSSLGLTTGGHAAGRGPSPHGHIEFSVPRPSGPRPVIDSHVPDIMRPQPVAPAAAWTGQRRLMTRQSSVTPPISGGDRPSRRHHVRYWSGRDCQSAVDNNSGFAPQRTGRGSTRAAAMPALMNSRALQSSGCR